MHLYPHLVIGKFSSSNQWFKFPSSSPTALLYIPGMPSALSQNFILSHLTNTTWTTAPQAPVINHQATKDCIKPLSYSSRSSSHSELAIILKLELHPLFPRSRQIRQKWHPQEHSEFQRIQQPTRRWWQSSKRHLSQTLSHFLNHLLQRRGPMMYPWKSTTLAKLKSPTR